jgi:hypothetical protein
VAEPIRQVGISEQTPSRWKKQYKGLETDRVRSSSNLANCLKACIGSSQCFPVRIRPIKVTDAPSLCGNVGEGQN